ncbi:MAG: regulatory iron-sulfur-containing complex subunit RicT [Phycisphaerales bacterium]|jgi:cell fate regulator YaaT (PSP1 superfamily)|nr:regulatory iron-sulfur-containing complex subunit RicT [Phycisphaerales bacterium]
MSIFPLPIFEADEDPSRRDALTLEEQLEAIESPETMVVRFGSMLEIGEYKPANDIRAGCGSKLVARTHRGTELVDLLTTTCSNSGCGQSISREEMLQYIENSGGQKFPFHTNGRVLRIATQEDMARMDSLRAKTKEYLTTVTRMIETHQLQMKMVEVEAILGEELLTFYYQAENRVDFRKLVQELAKLYSTRIEMRQVGSRDEARLVAINERCGEYCCCKSFLKVLTPVSMRSAKQQKQTLDPKKISGRCGRLMCCLRYEDQTYRELKRNLPHRKTRVGTPEGPGIVLDGKIITQLVLVSLEHDQRQIAVPVEELSDPDTCPRPWEEDQVSTERTTDGEKKETQKKRRNQKRRRRRGSQKGKNTEQQGSQPQKNAERGATKKKKRRRRRRRKGGGQQGNSQGSSSE